MAPTRRSYTRHDSPRKNRFIGAVLSGMEIAVAAEQENIPLRTAYNIKKKYDTYGSTTSLSRPGRPPKVDERLERQVVHEAQKNWREPFAEIAQNIEPWISRQTVGNILHKHGYHWWVARKVPFLTKAHKAASVRTLEGLSRLGCLGCAIEAEVVQRLL
jgi:transposase